ncbi:protein RALF-like 33 [Juglans microcarpa x Juglans regia]|uniref:protein RALF-like 33 n=1 Tax=Juglans microcarpa x Juglans regia TaxID=2249226 RepID=UPI001B7F24FE|nr:protein RALF-like 33 [Juglans microcarpa x Juglans regia]
MAKSSYVLLITFSFSITTIIISASTSTFADITSIDNLLSWVPELSCQGSIAECMAADDELNMDTEINRRILATTQTISYGALQRNTVPCSQRGASYYNCLSGAEANPYSRGCSAITRCRSQKLFCLLFSFLEMLLIS